jgi:hypothetical protein
MPCFVLGDNNDVGVGSQATFLREAGSEGCIECVAVEKIFICEFHQERARLGWLEMPGRECDGGMECSAKNGNMMVRVSMRLAMNIPDTEVQDILEGRFVVDSCTASQEDKYRVLLLKIFT